MRLKILRFVVAVMVLTTSTTVAPVAAQVHEPLVLPIDDVGEFLVDEPNGQMYISEGIDGNEVIVLDMDGQSVGTIDNLAGPGGLALSADGTTLWVALRYGDAVVGYSTETLLEIDRVNLPAATCPNHVAETAGKLVVDPYCGGNQLLVIDLAGDRSPVPVPITTYFLTNAILTTSPANPGVVIAAQRGGMVSKVDVSGEAPTIVASRQMTSWVHDVALDPTGIYLAVAGAEHSLIVLEVADLRSSDLYSTDAVRPGAVAWSADGGTIVTLADQVLTYTIGVSDPFWEYSLEGYRLAPRGLEIDAAGTVVFMLTHTSASPVELHIRKVGVSPGSISGTLHGYGGQDADLGEVELYDDEFRFISSVTGEYEDYKFYRLEPGTYYVFFWNGDDAFFWDYFPRWWADAPMYLPGQATPVVVGNGENVTGIDMVLPTLYYDMFDTVFGNDIFWLGNSGITKGCNPPENTMFCVDQPVTRGQMAAFLVRALGLTDPGDVDFVDDDGSIFESSIEKLAAAGITRGCNPPVNTMFCPNDVVTRGQMAAFLHRALG